MSIVSSIKGSIIGSIINNIAKSEPKTTALGAVLAAIQLANVDYGKLVQGDPEQVGRVVAAVVTALLGYFTNHKNLVSPPPTQ